MDSNGNSQSLNDEAQLILTTAAAANGYIAVTRLLNGRIILLMYEGPPVETDSPEGAAKLEEGLAQVVAEGLIARDFASQGEAYKLTTGGYKIARELRSLIRPE